MTVKAKCKTCVKVTPDLHITRSHCVCTICGAGRIVKGSAMKELRQKEAGL